MTAYRLGRYLRRHSRAVTFCLLLITVVLGLFSGRAVVDNSIAVWQAPDSPAWSHYQDFVRANRISDPLMIYLPGREARDLAESARELGQSIDVEKVALHDVIFRAQSGVILTLIPKLGLDGRVLGRLAESARGVLLRQLPATGVHMGGVWYLTHVLDSMSAATTRQLFPLVVLLATIAAALITRSAASTGMVLACGLLPALQLVGLMAMAHEPLNMILLALPPMVLILGMAHAIHFLQKRAAPVDRDVLQGYASVVPPCILCTLTTMIGFLSLLLGEYEPVRKLGEWGAVGTLLAAITPLALMPVFLRPERLNDGSDGNWARRWTAFLSGSGRLLLVGIVALTVLAGYGFSRLEKGSHILAFFQTKSLIRTDYQAIETAGIGLTPFEIDFVGKPVSLRDLRPIVDEFAARHEEITHFVLHSRLGRPGGDLSLPMATGSGAEIELPLLPLTSFGPVDRITLLTRTMAMEETIAMAGAVENRLVSRFGPRDRPYVTGTALLYASGQQYLFANMTRSFLGAFLSIALVVAVILRSLKLGVIAMLPNILPVFLTVGAMGLFGIPLSVSTITVASIVFGVITDDTIYFLHAWRQAGGTQRPAERLTAILADVGTGMITRSIIAGIGFLGFLLSPFLPLRDFGLLISLALVLALFCDLVLLPLLLMISDNGKREPERRVIA